MTRPVAQPASRTTSSIVADLAAERRRHSDRMSDLYGELEQAMRSATCAPLPPGSGRLAAAVMAVADVATSRGATPDAPA